MEWHIQLTKFAQFNADLFLKLKLLMLTMTENVFFSHLIQKSKI